ncbi:MAG: (Fe-S)-binding protein [Ardenticatenaceae bacterium]|nr:(Fe-S)-binding protein [Ardenticatenaceae bacterium]
MLSETIPGQQVFLDGLPDYADLSRCIHCGRCLPVCPTYQETLQEIQSPRGRLALLRAVEDGELDLTAGVEAHLHHCLDCRACNTVCPAGIPIGESIVAGRAAARARRPPGRLPRALLALLSRPRLMEALFVPARLYNATLRPLLWRSGAVRRLPARLQMLEATLLDRLSPPLRPALPARLPATADGTCKHRRVGYFVGCIMNVAFSEASQATIALLRRHGCEVVPLAPGCCGSPHEHAGLADAARAAARRAIAAVEADPDLDLIVCDSAGCTGMLKTYGHLLHDDPAWSECAAAFSARVRDATEFLDQILPPPGPSGAFFSADALERKAIPSLQSSIARSECWGGKQRPLRLTYHAPCHLANMQGIVAPPHRLLARLRHVEVVPLADERRCCGSAGTYNLTHPAMAQRLLDAKLDAIEATGAAVVASCNPGCQMHIAAGLRDRGSRVVVKHLSELLLEEEEAG